VYTYRLRAVTFCNATLGFVVGDGGSIMRTQDAGRNWNVIASGVTSHLSVVHCVDERLILVAGSKFSKVLYTVIFT
jgi:photosystem II stability/assembly factor-like uncharacterized protein